MKEIYFSMIKNVLLTTALCGFGSLLGVIVIRNFFGCLYGTILGLFLTYYIILNQIPKKGNAKNRGLSNKM